MGNTFNHPVTSHLLKSPLHPHTAHEFWGGEAHLNNMQTTVVGYVGAIAVRVRGEAGAPRTWNLLTCLSNIRGTNKQKQTNYIPHPPAPAPLSQPPSPSNSKKQQNREEMSLLINCLLQRQRDLTSRPRTYFFFFLEVVDGRTLLEF